MIKKKFLPVLLMIVGLIGWIPYNAQKDNSEVTIQTLSETHVNYKDAEEHALLLEKLSQEAQESEKQRRLNDTKAENEEIAKAKAAEAKIIAEAQKAEEAKKAEEERIAQEVAEEEARAAEKVEEAAVTAVSVAQEVAVVSEPAYTEPVVNEVVEQAAPVQAHRRF